MTTRAWCHTDRLQQGGRRLNITGPPPKFYGTRDILFSGRKGRTRLAVIDGVVNISVVRLIVSALPEKERVVVCGTGIDTDARPILRELRPGSTLRKIPAALLDEYRSARQLRLLSPESDGSEPAVKSAGSEAN